MTDVEDCCGKRPTVHKKEYDPNGLWMHTTEMIECFECSRVVYGVDEDSVEKWNNGEDDEGNSFIRLSLECKT